MPVRYDDLLYLLIPFYNFSQKIEASEITFFQLERIQSSSIDCPIEKMHNWVTYDYYKNPINFEVEDLIRSYPKKLKTLNLKKSSVNSNFKIEF